MSKEVGDIRSEIGIRVLDLNGNHESLPNRSDGAAIHEDRWKGGIAEPSEAVIQKGRKETGLHIAFHAISHIFNQLDAFEELDLGIKVLLVFDGKVHNIFKLDTLVLLAEDLNRGCRGVNGGGVEGVNQCARENNECHSDEPPDTLA